MARTNFYDVTVQFQIPKRWYGPVDFRVAESDLPANYRWAGGHSERVDAP